MEMNGVITFEMCQNHQSGVGARRRYLLLRAYDALAFGGRAFNHASYRSPLNVAKPRLPI